MVERLDQELPRRHAELLARTATQRGVDAKHVLATYRSVDGIDGIFDDKTAGYTELSLIAGVPPTGFADAWRAADALDGVFDDASVDLATRMVLRGYEPARLRPTWQALDAVDGLFGENVLSILRASVAANAPAQAAVDAFAWYRSQEPSRNVDVATSWTVDHLRERSGGFDAYVDDLVQRVMAAAAGA